MAKISVNIPDDMKLELMSIAKKEERDMSWLIRKIISKYLREAQSKESK